MSEKDVELGKLANDLLTIKGEKKEEKEEKREGYHLSEWCMCSFERSFRVPEGVDTDKIEANFNKGVLTGQTGRRSPRRWSPCAVTTSSPLPPPRGCCWNGCCAPGRIRRTGAGKTVAARLGVRQRDVRRVVRILPAFAAQAELLRRVRMSDLRLFLCGDVMLGRGVRPPSGIAKSTGSFSSRRSRQPSPTFNSRRK